jgi:outer membrane receptor protein involved in Fe transport
MDKIFGVILLSFWLSLGAAQKVTLSGTITDGSEVLSNVNVAIAGTTIGTATDEEGTFELTTKLEPPYVLLISAIGYRDKRIELDAAGSGLKIRLESMASSLDQVVVSASRYGEKIMEAPVAIYKLTGAELKSMGGVNAYESVQSMRGIQAQTSSLSLPSYNTRGFSDPGNFRFKQQLDGFDMTNPIGLAIANTMGVSDLDLSSVELVHGAASALYGSDAFNGVLRFSSKNPFDFPGFSFQTKTGVTVQEAAGTNPYFEQDFRLGHVFSKKFAFKMDLSFRQYHDWIGDDQSHRIPAGRYDDRGDFPDQPPEEGFIAHDGVHSLGNEYGNGVGTLPGIDFLVGPGSDTLMIQGAPLTRTGIREKDLFTIPQVNNNEMESFRGNFSFFYRPTEDWEWEYTYKHSYSDWMIRSSSTFPQFDYLQRMHLLRTSYKGFTGRIYRHKLDNFRGSWSAANAANAIQQALRPNDLWAADFSSEYQRTGSLQSARSFADRFMPGGEEFNDQDFQAALAATSRNTDYSGLNSTLIAGSQAVDYSSYTNMDLDYDFEEQLPFKLQVGVNYRRIKVNSDGAFYNDGPLGFGEPIIVNQMAGYAQASREFIQRRLRLTAALRADKQTDYQLNWSPRITAVLKAGRERDHIFRASYLTGFRNPSIQEGFFRLQLTSTFTNIGTARRSLENFVYRGPSGTEYQMLDILEADGRGFGALQPERNSSLELGYRTHVKNRLYIDLSAYGTQYQNFINRPNVFFRPEEHPEDFQIFAIRQNREETVVGYGAGLGLDYVLTQNLTLGLTYDWNDYDSPDYEPDPNAEDPSADKAAFLRSLQFNLPEHRATATLSAKRLGPNERWGAHYNFRYNSSYNYFSNFGEALIPSFNTSDVSVSYALPDWRTTLKIGASNVFRQEYITIYGAPMIGSMYYLSVRYE